MGTTDEDISRFLPRDYRDSRDIEQVKKTWNPILQQEMSRHWDMIREGMKGFSLAYDKVLKALAKYERDETAEIVCREFLDNMFPGALDVLTQIGPLVDQYPSCFADEEAMALDDSDTRSVTMGPEPSSSKRPGLTTSMGPPPRPFALMLAEPSDPIGKGRTGACGDVPDSPPPGITDHGPLTLQQNGKRTLDTLEGEPLQASEMPSKKARKTNGAQKTINYWDLEGVEYIFKDKRCGPGYYVIRCNVERHPPLGHPGVFVKPPLEGTNALDHFNSKGHTCHDSSKEYSIDDIIREFSHRVQLSDGTVTAARVRSSNEKLQKAMDKKATEASASAKKSPKGKDKASDTDARFHTMRSIRVGSNDSLDDPFQDEVRARPL